MGISQTDIITEPVLEMACSSCAHPLDVSGLPAFTEIACPECHTPQVVPTRLGPFLLVELLGRGGMGAVYRGHDTSLDRWVAIKVMLATLGENQDFVTTFRREAQAAAALNHPNIVQIYSFGVAHGQAYMAMELLEGGRLDHMIAKGEPIDESLLIKITADVAEGLNAAASIGLVHGDVKPENVLLDSNGVAKVVDFGLARFKQSKEPSVQGIWGTPYYIAPEKVRGQPGDARSDIYSLGGTLFHALTLRPPFEGETAIDVVKARLVRPPPLLRTIRPGATPEVEAIVARMLEADPAQRYPTYSSLLSDLRKAQATLKPPVSGSFGAPLKRGGKIVLTKKRGSGSATSSAPSSPIVIRSSQSSLRPPMPLGAEPPKKPRGLGCIVAVGIMACLLAAGGITGYILYRNALKAEILAAEKENTRLQNARAGIDTLWNDLTVLTSNATVRGQAAKSWIADADLAAVFINSSTDKLTDASLVAEAQTNPPAWLQIISQASTGTLSGFLAELEAFTNAVGTNRVAMLASTNAAQVEQTLTALTNIPSQALTLIQTWKTEAEKAETALKNLLALKSRIASAAAAQASIMEREAKERAEAERLAREEAAAQQEAAEKDRQVQAEIGLIQELRKTNGPLIQQNQFKQASDSLAAISGSLKTDAGKAALKLTAERYQLLIGLKAFIIQAVNTEVKANPATGYKFGWLSSKDILAADDEKITVRGGSIPWAQTPPAQMLRFIRHYLSDPDLARRETALQSLAAAVYTFEAGVGSESARKMAMDFTEEALRASPSMGSQIKALFPDSGVSP